MILLAESGSTKTDWVAFSKNSTADITIKTAGFNPHIFSTSDITKQLFLSSDLKNMVPLVKHIHFYGAGCSTDSMKKVVKDALRSLFPTARIKIFHDLDAAVRGTWNGKPAVTSILGTGSNCCFFDGDKTIQQKPSLGYLLGDEGSGKDIGGKLYRAIVYKEAPVGISDKFFAEYNFKKEELVTLLYSKEKPNEFLASFMPFIKKNRNEAFIRNLIIEGFTSFVNTHLKAYATARNLEYHFIGSVAFHFQKELAFVLKQEGIEIGSVLQSPLEGLVEYYKENS